jgi:hypothetical protein
MGIDTVRGILKTFLVSHLDHTPPDDRTLYVSSVVRCPYKNQFHYSRPGGYNWDILAGQGVHLLFQSDLQTIWDESWSCEQKLSWDICLDDSNTYKLLGRVDAISDAYKILLEIKTGQSSAEHILQIKTYLNKFPDYTGYLVYFPKNTKLLSIDNIVATQILEVNEGYDEHQIKSMVWRYINGLPPATVLCLGCKFAQLCPHKTIE